MRNKIEFIIKGGEVRRFHTQRTIQEDTVGHHSFLVAMLCSILDPLPSKFLLLAALTHDLAEHVVGDVPSPIKAIAGKEISKLEDAELSAVELSYENTLTEEEKRTLRLADLLAGLTFCQRESSMGNSLILDCRRNYQDMIYGMKPFNDVEGQVVQIIDGL